MSNSCGVLLSVDPSVRSAGVALFRGGVLAACGTVRAEARENESPAARCLRVAGLVADWAAEAGPRPRSLAVEWPGKSWRGDARDLHGLCGVVGALSGMLAVAAAASGEVLPVASYEPGEWSGGTPKAKTGSPRKSVRAGRIEARLSTEERAIWDAHACTHDAVDAVGIGLFSLGRLAQRRVYSSGEP
jgi:hypothetical protein